MLTLIGKAEKLRQANVRIAEAIGRIEQQKLRISSMAAARGEPTEQTVTPRTFRSRLANSSLTAAPFLRTHNACAQAAARQPRRAYRQLLIRSSSQPTANRNRREPVQSHESANAGATCRSQP